MIAAVFFASTSHHMTVKRKLTISINIKKSITNISKILQIVVLKVCIAIDSKISIKLGNKLISQKRISIKITPLMITILNILEICAKAHKT